MAKGKDHKTISIWQQSIHRQHCKKQYKIERKWQQCDWQNVGHDFHVIATGLSLVGWSRPRLTLTQEKHESGSKIKAMIAKIRHQIPKNTLS